jgi:hypothetical protein
MFDRIGRFKCILSWIYYNNIQMKRYKHHTGYELHIEKDAERSILLLTQCSGLKIRSREGKGDTFFRNVGYLSTDYTALFPIGYNS